MPTTTMCAVFLTRWSCSQCRRGHPAAAQREQSSSVGPGHAATYDARGGGAVPGAAAPDEHHGVGTPSSE